MEQEKVVMNVSRVNHVLFSFPVFTGYGRENEGRQAHQELQLKIRL